jgi:hypothetical protein
MMFIISVAVFLAALAGIVTSVTLLWRKVVHPFWRFCRRLGRVAEVIHELPEWCAQVDTVLMELKPNHGGSVKDKILDIQERLMEHSALLSEFAGRETPSTNEGTTVIVHTSSTMEGQTKEPTHD